MSEQQEKARERLKKKRCKQMQLSMQTFYTSVGGCVYGVYPYVGVVYVSIWKISLPKHKHLLVSLLF